MELTGGGHDILVEFINSGGETATKDVDGIRLLWSSDGLPKEVVPASALSRMPPAPAVAISGGNGRYRFPKLEPADYTLEALVPGGSPAPEMTRTVTVVTGNLIPDMDFQLSPFKKGHWSHYTTLDGLGHNNVSAAFQAADGAL